jgi:hypothetical protein
MARKRGFFTAARRFAWSLVVSHRGIVGCGPPRPMPSLALGGFRRGFAGIEAHRGFAEPRVAAPPAPFPLGIDRPGLRDHGLPPRTIADGCARWLPARICGDGGASQIRRTSGSPHRSPSELTVQHRGTGLPPCRHADSCARWLPARISGNGGASRVCRILGCRPALSPLIAPDAFRQCFTRVGIRRSAAPFLLGIDHPASRDRLAAMPPCR